MPRPRRIRRLNPKPFDRRRGRFFGAHHTRVDFSIPVKSGKARRDIQIRLVGFTHNDTGYPPLRSVVRKVSQELGEVDGPILSEFDWNDFIRRRFGRRVEFIDSEAITRHAKNQVRWKMKLSSELSTLLSEIGEGWAHYFVDWLSSRISHSESAGRLRINQEDAHKYRSKMVRSFAEDPSYEKTFRGFAHLVITGRSLLLAARALERCEHSGYARVSVVVGSSHVEEIYRFLHAPTLAYRYARACRMKLEKAGFPYDVVREIRDAEECFKRQLD